MLHMTRPWKPCDGIATELGASWARFESGVLWQADLTPTPIRVVFILEAESLARAHPTLGSS